MAAALISRGADVRLQNNTGWTALLIAERKGRARVVAVLSRGRAESLWGALPSAAQPFEAQDISPRIEASDHPDA